MCLLFITELCAFFIKRIIEVIIAQIFVTGLR